MCTFLFVFNMSRKILVFLMVMTVVSVKAETNGQQSMTFCVESMPNPPYIYPNQQGRPSGLLIDIVKKSAEQIGVVPVFVMQPWLRCQKLVRANKAQALFALIKTPEREQHYVFPSDLHYLWKAQYPVFTLKENEFHPERYTPTSGLGAPFGYVVTDILLEKNWLNPYSYKVDKGMQMVASGKLDGYAVERQIGENVVAQLGLSHSLKASNSVLVSSYWHVPFNVDFYEENKPQVDAFWRIVAQERDAATPN